MKSVYMKKPWDITLLETEVPRPKEGQALIKVKSVGICGSDVGAYRGVNPLISYPRVIGHEVAGEVVEIPENKKGIKAGDRVIVDPYLYCGHCYPCSIGRTNCCTDLKVLGVHVDGGMGEYFTHPADMLIKVPDDMEWEMVPLAEPLTIALHGLHRAGLSAGEHIAINGAGPIGLMAAMAAIEYKAIPIMIDIVDERLEKAKSVGVTHTVNLMKEDFVQRVSEITNGRMAEVVMEASGANSAIRGTLDIVSNAGRIILTGWPKDSTSIPTDLITKKEVDIRGARTSAGEFEEAIALIYENKINMKALLSEVVSLEELPQAVANIEKNPGDYLKVVGVFNDR